MWKWLLIVALAVGSMASLLMPLSGHIARHLSPGPTVKGPGDLYAQAFGVLIVLVGLIAIALLASVVVWIGSYAIGWKQGQWLACIPVVVGVFTMAVFWFFGRD